MERSGSMVVKTLPPSDAKRSRVTCVLARLRVSPLVFACLRSAPGHCRAMPGDVERRRTKTRDSEKSSDTTRCVLARLRLSSLVDAERPRATPREDERRQAKSIDARWRIPSLVCSSSRGRLPSCTCLRERRRARPSDTE